MNHYEQECSIPHKRVITDVIKGIEQLAVEEIRMRLKRLQRKTT